jgi:AcrR family transcriptional regulator
MNNGSITSTKDRILDAAERLFAIRGFEATSLRAITAEAGVNLAAVNYHFQSKDTLLRAVVARRIEPVNCRRLELLDAWEANGCHDLYGLIRAFMIPAIELKRTNARNFLPLLGRMYTEPGEFVEHVFKEHLREVSQRFIAAFQGALPQLSRADVIWRIHFMVGIMCHVLAGAHIVRFSSGGLCDPDDIDGTIRRVVAFLEAGFAAPVAEATQHVY